MENNNMMGLVFSGNPEVNLGEIMKVRSLAAVPVGGKYRIIDFVLSNMVNSGIANVGIITGGKNRSLSDHIGSGKAWDMAKKETGLFFLPVSEASSGAIKSFNGIDLINSAMSFLERARQEYVLVCDCNIVCNINFENVMEFHKQHDADITVVYSDVGELSSDRLKSSVLLDVDEDGRVGDVQVNPLRQKLKKDYMHMFLLKKDLLIDIVGDCLAHNKHSIEKNILLACVDRLKIFGYRFDGYHKAINSILSFFEFNLDLLSPQIQSELFGTDTERAIMTKVKDSVPTRYGTEAEVKNSVVADGCSIEGKVENCVIFRGVKVGKDSVVRDSVIMQNSRIMDNCKVENSIFDKEVILLSGKKLIGQQTYPLVIGKRTIV
ncbi:MAG: glucose-1-phosphate adenylyltransferase subunit GlgD [Clostridia bacterium]|nr:glucose-1-phosphate adenylyltransferase subunit GlgD [Clostridia bacterium]